MRISRVNGKPELLCRDLERNDLAQLLTDAPKTGISFQLR
jgi:hypothetical protein